MKGCTFKIVECYFKKVTMARRVVHCIRDDRLHVQDNILLFKKVIVTQQVGQLCISDKRLHVQESSVLLQRMHCGMAGNTLHQRREVKRLVQQCAVIENSLWHGRQDIASGKRDYMFRTVFCYNKKITAASQAGHCIRDEGLHIQDSCVL